MSDFINFVGFMKFRFLGDYTQKYARYGDEPKCENGENRVVYAALGSIWSLDPLGPRNVDIKNYVRDMKMNQTGKMLRLMCSLRLCSVNGR